MNLCDFSQAKQLFKENNNIIESTNFSILKKFIKTILEMNDTSIDEIYETYVISNQRYKEMSAGIYTYWGVKNDNEENEKEILKISLILCGNIPSA